MGYYINSTSTGIHIGADYENKVAHLIADGATKTTGDTFEENLVCVIDNGFFAAAAYIYSEDEYNEFKFDDGRLKQWLIYKDAKKLSGYPH